jgi:hypothetical protein
LGRQDSNLRPHGPESSGCAPQTVISATDATPPAPICTQVCCETEAFNKVPAVETLAAALLALSREDRARLAAMLLGEQAEGKGK